MAYTRQNPNLFTTTNAGKADLDIEFNTAVGRDNDLLLRIAAIVQAALPGLNDARNISKVPTTDGANLNWAKIDSSFFNLNSVDGSLVLQEASVPQNALGVGSVGTLQIIDANITLSKMAIDSISNANVIDNTLLLPKMRSTGHSCFLVGSDANYNYAEITYNTNGSDLWKIPTQIAQKATPSLQNIWDIFNIAPNTPFNGAQIALNTITGAQIAPLSVPTTDLKSNGYAAVVCANRTDYSFAEVQVGPLQVVSRGSNSNALSAFNLSDIFNNEAGTPYKGSQLQDGSVSKTKILEPVTTFAWARVDGDGNILKGYNVQSVVPNGTGLYTVKFLSSAPNTNYCVTMNAFNGNGQNTISVGNVYEGTQTTGQFDVWTKTSGIYTNTGFYITVFSA